MSTVIVTGASKGLGLALAEFLLRAGHTVVGISRGNCPHPDIRHVACDVTDYAGLKRVASDLRKHDQVSGLINAAGIASMNLALATPPEVTERIIQVNLLGTIYCCQVFGKLLARQKCGSIVNFSTIAVSLGLQGESVYVASKAGVEGFTRAFAREMADFQVTVNVVAPGPVATELTKHVPARNLAKIVERQIIPQQAEASDVCDIVSLLLSQQARKLTGQVFNVCGA